MSTDLVVVLCALLSACSAEAALRPVFNELCFNLESFNPAFAACLLQASVCVCVCVLLGGKTTQQRSDDLHTPLTWQNPAADAVLRWVLTGARVKPRVLDLRGWEGNHMH
jgi:hypothetical protein